MWAIIIPAAVVGGYFLVKGMTEVKKDLSSFDRLREEARRRLEAMKPTQVTLAVEKKLPLTESSKLKAKTIVASIKALMDAWNAQGAREKEETASNTRSALWVIMKNADTAHSNGTIMGIHLMDIRDAFDSAKRELDWIQRERVAEIPTMAPPPGYESSVAITKRLDDIRTLWRMGRIRTKTEANAMLDQLRSGIVQAATAGAITRAELSSLTMKLDLFRKEVSDSPVG
jgi:hypothetical protein